MRRLSLIVAAMLVATGAMAQTAGSASTSAGATVQSSSGTTITSGTGVAVTPGTTSTTTTVMGAAPGPVTTTSTTTRTWTGLTMFPADVERHADFQRWMRLK